MKKSVTTIAVVALGALFALTSPADASDGKVYPGALCQMDDTVGTGTLYRSTNGRLFNMHTTEPLFVVCPIVRDATTSDWLEVSIVVRSASGVLEGSSCVAETRTKTGVLENSTSFGVPDTSFTEKTFGNISAPDRGFYQIRCALVPKQADGTAAGIASYFVVEEE